jgi:hypothetical protein
MFSIKGKGFEEIKLFDLPPVVRLGEPAATDVQMVFDHWVSVHRTPRRGPKPVLGDKRKSKIAKAIRDYGVEICLQAISGCAMSDWHMGDNPRRKRYDDIELILRDSAHIERFATIFAEGGEDDPVRQEFLRGENG